MKKIWLENISEILNYVIQDIIQDSYKLLSYEEFYYDDEPEEGLECAYIALSCNTVDGDTIIAIANMQKSGSRLSLIFPKDWENDFIGDMVLQKSCAYDINNAASELSKMINFGLIEEVSVVFGNVSEEEIENKDFSAHTCVIGTRYPHTEISISRNRVLAWLKIEDDILVNKYGIPSVVKIEASKDNIRYFE